MFLPFMASLRKREGMGQGKDLACSMIPDEPALNLGSGDVEEVQIRGQESVPQDTGDDRGVDFGYGLVLRSSQVTTSGELRSAKA